jgi:hypothetical protein
MRGEYERDRAFARRGAQLRKQIGMIVNLGRVVAAEFLPAGWIVSEPLSQRRAGSNVLDPPIYGCIRLSYPSRPQAIDQYPRTILRRWRAIRSFQLDISCHDSLLHLVASHQK